MSGVLKCQSVKVSGVLKCQSVRSAKVSKGQDRAWNGILILKVPSHDFFSFFFIINLHLVGIFMYTQWFEKFGL